MIDGRLISERFPYLPIHIESRAGQTDADALLDTGFDGDFALPPEALTSSQPDGHLRSTLADGSLVLAPYYIGTISVDALGPVSLRDYRPR